MTKKYSLAGIAAKGVMLALSFGMMSTSPVVARELSIAIPHANLRAFTTEAECIGKYGADSGCDNVLGKPCESSFGRGIWTTQMQFDAIYDAIINKDATAVVILLNDGSNGKIPGSFGPKVCSLSKK